MITVSLSVPQALWDNISNHAEEAGVTAEDYVRNILYDSIHEKPNDS